jgi:hypothetical protein
MTTYKQADLTLTGTMRKAQLAATATKTSRRPIGPAYATSPAPSMQDQPKRRASSISTTSQFLPQVEEKMKQCHKCHVKFSPIWWPADKSQEPGDSKILCHKCHWAIVQVNGKVNGDDSSENSLPNGTDRVQGSRVGIAVQ